MPGLFQEQGYEISNQTKISVTTDADSTDINGTVRLHNTGANIVYISSKSGVTSDKWELAPGEKEGPFSFQKLYYVGAGASTLKVLHLKGV